MEETLRDKFAMSALQACYAHEMNIGSQYNHMKKLHQTDAELREYVVKVSYELADAMLAERLNKFINKAAANSMESLWQKKYAFTQKDLQIGHLMVLGVHIAMN